MRCEEYRRALQRALDARDRRPLASDYLTHVEMCDACRAYAEDMRLIERNLSGLELSPLPEGLQEKLLRISEATSVEVPATGWWRDVQRAAVFIVPALAVAAIALLAPPVVQALAELVLCCVGLAFFLTTALRPRIVGE